MSGQNNKLNKSYSLLRSKPKNVTFGQITYKYYPTAKTAIAAAELVSDKKISQIGRVKAALKLLLTGKSRVMTAFLPPRGKFRLMSKILSEISDGCNGVRNNSFSEVYAGLWRDYGIDLAKSDITAVQLSALLGTSTKAARASGKSNGFKPLDEGLNELAKGLI